MKLLEQINIDIPVFQQTEILKNNSQIPPELRNLPVFDFYQIISHHSEIL